VHRVTRSLPPLRTKHKVVVFAGFVLLALLGIAAVFGEHGVAHLFHLHRQQEEAERLAAVLSSENQRLREHLRRLQRDDIYLETLARERLGWIKPGEIVYHVAPKRDSAPSGTLSAPDGR
jgi:cell division protein FtsB